MKRWRSRKKWETAGLETCATLESAVFVKVPLLTPALALTQYRGSWFVFSLLLLSLNFSCATRPPSQLTRFEFKQPQMGGPFRRLLHAPEKSIAETAADSTFKRSAELNAIMSDYEDDSELSRLS